MDGVQTNSPVLLTGATGFLGRHVLAAFAAKYPGRPIYALVRQPADWNALDHAALYPQVILIEGDLVENLLWLEDPRLQAIGGIIHLAAIVKHSRRDPEPAMKTNIDGTLHLVRLAGVRQVPMTYVSTSGVVAVHRVPGTLVTEEAPYVVARISGWPYYFSKVQAERHARALAGERGVPLTILRPPILLGPGDHRFRSTGNVIRFLRGKLPFLIDGGISFCDIRDAAAAIVAAFDHPAQRPVYHLPGHDMAIGEFFALCEKVSGVPAPKRFLPYWTARQLAGAAEAVAHAVGGHSILPDPVVIEMARHHWGIGSRHAETELGYRTRGAEETLRDTIAWLSAHHPLIHQIELPNMKDASQVGETALAPVTKPVVEPVMTPEG